VRIGFIVRITAVVAAIGVAFVAGCDENNPVVQEEESISTPTAPSGPTSILVDSLAQYATGGAESSVGDDVEYQFDWGDGRLSTWVSPAEATTSWPSSGSRDVRARARCAVHTTHVSDWSDLTSVQVGIETVSQPAAPAGIDVLCTGSVTLFRSGGSTSDVGHPVEYQFDWGDGLSYWMSADSVQHAWALAGGYDCRARARCTLDTTVTSAWSASTPVSIESHAGPWLVEQELPDLVGDHLTSRIARFTYDGPRARVTRLTLDLTGYAAGSTCRLDGDPNTYTIDLIVWPVVANEGKSNLWAPLGMFFGVPGHTFDTTGYWVDDSTSDWTETIFEPGDKVAVRLHTQIDDNVGCGWGQAGCNVYSASITLEFECVSE